LLLLVGFYHFTSFIVNGLELPLEPGTARFADYSPNRTTDHPTG
jgi:hypothetical protein